MRPQRRWIWIGTDTDSLPSLQATIVSRSARAITSVTVKRQGWRNEHILVVREDDERLDFVEREFIRRLGERLYGAPESQHD